MTWKIRSAKEDDFLKLRVFLTEAGVTSEGLKESIRNFSIIESDDGKLKACVGIEAVGQVGLLRSFVVSPQIAQPELLLLFKRAFLTGKNQQLEALYLVSNKLSAVSLFGSLGFEIVNKSQLPEALLAKNHLKHVLTVDNSTVMKIIL